MPLDAFRLIVVDSAKAPQKCQLRRWSNSCDNFDHALRLHTLHELLVMLLFTWQGQVASGDPPGRGIGLPRSSGTADPGECKLRPAFLDADFQGPRVTTLRVKKSRMDHHHHEYNRCLSDVMQVNAGTSLCFNIPSGPGRRNCIELKTRMEKCAKNPAVSLRTHSWKST